VICEERKRNLDEEVVAIARNPKSAVEAALPRPRSVYADELKRFLNSGDQKVLLLHGRWGTGKTYFWRHFIEQEQRSVTECFYSYVSLFGASSVAHVKSLVLFGGKPVRSADDLPSLGRRVANFIAGKRHYLPDISLPHVGNIGKAIGAFDELLIKSYLVCFDDLERRNNQLDLEQFFGLVSLLKEQNDCRVVIICNESELSEDDIRTLNKYREKIVDRQLTYDPLFDENFRIIFPQPNPSIREVFEALGLNNIRVFQQTRWCIEYFQPQLANCDASFIDKFNQQCARFACVHFALSKQITLQQLRRTSWLGASLSERGGLSEASADIVRNLQFLPTDADDFIVDYLRNGYCDTAKFRSTVERLNREHRRREADQFLTQIWRKVWDSYQCDAEEIARAADEYATKYRDYIPYKYASDLLDFVKKIAPSFDAESKKESVAKALIPIADPATLRLIQASCESPEVKEQAKRKETELESRRSIEQLVLSLGESNGWNPPDFAELNQYSEDELFQWLSSAHQPYLLSIIAEVIARGQLESADNKGGNSIGVKFRKVFERLAKRSPLDKERTTHAFALVCRQVKQYGREVSPDICPSEADSEDRS
jgi:KAP family P-loop domain